MRKVGLILMPAFIFAMALAAHAQKVNTKDDRADTVKVTVSGVIDFDGIFRDGELMDARGSDALSGFANTDEDQYSIEGDIIVRLDIDLSEKISAVVELRNQRADGGVVNAFGENAEATGVIFSRASIKLNEFLTAGLTLDMGIVPVAYDLRGKGSAFFFDPANSNTFGKNAAGSGTTVVGTQDYLQPAGLHGVYTRDALTLGVFLLPAIIEAGRATDDEAAYGVWFTYKLDSIGKGSQVGLIFAIDTFAGHETAVFTIGAGIDWHGLTEGLELYTEIYFQFGNAGQAVILGVTEDIDAGGFAFQIGGQYNFQTDNNIWVALNLTWISGDDDAGDTDNDNFLSYENVNDLKILEDQWFGFDLDTNYLSIKISGGVAFTIGSGAMKNNLEIGTILGFNFLTEEVLGTNGAFSEGLFPGATNTGDDAIGHEWDVWARLHASKQVSFNVGLAFLFSSDLLEDTGTSDENNVFLAWLGADLKF